MYKVIFVPDTQAHDLETAMNDAAAEGFEYLNSFHTNGRFVVIFKRSAPRGRPRKQADE